MKFGTTELVIVLVILILLLGPTQIPKLIRMFRRSSKGSAGAADEPSSSNSSGKKIDLSKWLDEGDPSQFTQARIREFFMRLGICVIVLVVVFLVTLYFSQSIVSFVSNIAADYGYELAVLSPQDLLKDQFSIALAAAVCFTVPLLVYHLWAFFKPGVLKKQKHLFIAVVISDLVCFVIGIVFSYLVLLPFMLKLLA